MRLFKYILIIIVMLGMMVLISMWSRYKHGIDIKDWANKNNKELIEFDTQWSTSGSPFYYKGKGQHIYKIVVINKSTNKKEIWYMRTNIFRNEYIKNN